MICADKLCFPDDLTNLRIIFFKNHFKKTRNILSLSQMKANYIFFPQSNMGGCVSIIITLKKDLVAKMYHVS